MISNLHTGSRAGSVLTLAGVAILFVFGITMAAAIPPLQTQSARSETTLTATSANVSDAGRAVKINILRWSTDEERNALVVAMNPPPPVTTAPEASAERGRGGAGRGGAGAAGGRGRGGRGDAGANAAPPKPLAALTAAIEKAQTIGYLWMGDSNIGYAIHYAYRTSMPDGGQRIILAANRRLGEADASWKPAPPATATDYDFTVIEVRLDAKGLGEGKASINTKVVADADAKTIALDNYAATPVLLKNVKR
jgi:hypothetical protein